jgi:hypothetical protein
VDTIFGLSLASIQSAATQAAALYQSSSTPDDNMDWPLATFIAVAVAAGCSLVAVIVWQVFLTARKSIEKNQDKAVQEELQTLTQRTIASSEAAAKELAQLSQGMADLRARVTVIETMLREVE